MRSEAPPLAVLVHHRLEAAAAIEHAKARGEAIELCIPAGLAGPAFVKALEATLQHPLTALCDDEPGLVMAALRAGLRRLVFTGPENVRQRLAGMAAGLGAEYCADATLNSLGVAGGLEGLGSASVAAMRSNSSGVPQISQVPADRLMTFPSCQAVTVTA